MRLTRLFAPVAPPEFRLEEDAAHHLRVLRLRPGDRFLAIDQGCDWLCELTRGGKAKVLESRPARPEPSVALDLKLALVKGERFDQAVEMASELGVRSITPLLTGRTVGEQPGVTRIARWERISRSAAALSGRAHFASIEPVLRLEEALASCGPGILFCPGQKALRELPAGQRLSLWLGPEGGFAPEEVEGASRQGLVLAGLGERILRVETAAVVALTLVLQLAGEL
ncbi:MAG: ribosomal RNA small subunit methyltransferase E [Candidatus Xenobia bacterium]